MATVADISQALGDHILKGWVLTDQSCPTPGCAVPLVRSPNARSPTTLICVKCAARNAPTSDTSTESQNSRSSTPPTDFSEIPESPIFIPLQETEETRRRRAQSDQASTELGQKLLKGWAMLGEECPNQTCYGVPLVRPPGFGGEKDPKKECVICGNVYVSEVDWTGRETLVPHRSKSNASVNSQIPHDSTTRHQPSPAPTGLQRLEKKVILPRDSSLLALQPIVPDVESNSASTSPQIVLDETSRALQMSLRALSVHLTSLVSTSAIDPVSVGATADAIIKVTQALMQVQGGKK